MRWRSVTLSRWWGRLAACQAVRYSPASDTMSPTSMSPCASPAVEILRPRGQKGGDVPHDFLTVLVLLCFGHSLADYPLQGQFLADGKNRHTVVGQLFWPYYLSSHATIHAGFVLMITGSVYLALAEFIVHGTTDWMK